MQVFTNQKWGLFKDRDLKQNYRHPRFRMNTKPDPRDQFSRFPADNEVHGFHYGGKTGVPPNHQHLTILVLKPMVLGIPLFRKPPNFWIRCPVPIKVTRNKDRWLYVLVRKHIKPFMGMLVVQRALGITHTSTVPDYQV